MMMFFGHPTGLQLLLLASVWLELWNFEQLTIISVWPNKTCAPGETSDDLFE